MGWFDWLFGRKRPSPTRPAMRSVAVTVFDAAGKPVPNARVTLDDRPSPHKGMTNVDGYVVFTTVPAGLVDSHLWIEVESNRVVDQHVRLAPVNMTIRVGEPKRATVDLELPPVRRPGVLPSGNPLAIRTDFLTLRHPDNPLEVLYPGPFPAYGAGQRARVLEAHRLNGYTDYWLDVAWGRQAGGLLGHIPPYDYLDRPHDLVPILKEIVAAGLRPIIVTGFEDNAEARAKYPTAKFVDETLPAFISVVDEWVGSYLLGVEVREFWTWDEILSVIACVARWSGKPIIVHQNQRKWGPDGEDPWKGRGGMEMTWWREAKRAAGDNPIALGFQGGHGRTGEPGGGFLTPREELVRDIKGFIDPSRLGGIGVPVIAAEYAFKVSDAKAKALGAAALEAGAVGFMNGGPGRP